VSDQRDSRHAITKDHVQSAGRQAGLHRELGQAKGAQGRLGRWLDHDRVAESQRRRDLPRRKQERKVEWGDRRDDSDGLAQGIGKEVARDRQRMAGELCGVAGEVFEAVSR